MHATDRLRVLALASLAACPAADYELGALAGETDSGSGSGDGDSDGTAASSSAITDGSASASGTDGAPFVDPLDGVGPIKVWVDTGIGTAVGGLWDDAGTALLVADSDANAVLRVTLSTVDPVLSDAGGPSGLAFDGDGSLLVAQAQAGRLVRFDGDTVDVVADALGSPASVVVAASGHRYVTDPVAGAVHRIDPDGASHQDVDLPAARGAALDPGGELLFVVPNGTTGIHAIPIDPTGKLGAPTPFAQSAAPLAGVCVDEHSNVLAAGQAGIEAFRPDGESWGSLPTAEAIVDCSFGRNGTATVLFLVAASTIYVADLPVDGAP